MKPEFDIKDLFITKYIKKNYSIVLTTTIVFYYSRYTYVYTYIILIAY